MIKKGYMKTFFAWIASFFKRAPVSETDKIIMDSMSAAMKEISYAAKETSESCSSRKSKEIRQRLMRDAKDVVVHSPLEKIVTMTFNPVEDGQIHVIKPESYSIQVVTRSWPKRTPQQHPAVMYLCVENLDRDRLTSITYKDNICWVSREKTSPVPGELLAKHPIISFWSWGNGIVYAGEMYQLLEDDVS